MIEEEVEGGSSTTPLDENNTHTHYIYIYIYIYILWWGATK